MVRYFYNHLSNCTKTIIRLMLVNIGEYSLRLRRIIVKYILSNFLLSSSVKGVQRQAFRPEKNEISSWVAYYSMFSLPMQGSILFFSSSCQPGKYA